jgi:class 3 adenylate cyclase
MPGTLDFVLGVHGMRKSKTAGSPAIDRHRSPRSTKLADLSGLALFQGVPQKLLKLITADMVGCFRTGQEIVREDDAAGGLIVLLHGQARVMCNGTYLVTRRTGETIGEQAILDRTGRSATAVADGMVKALIVPRPIVDGMFENAAFARNIAKGLSSKLREATRERAIRYRDEERLFAEFSAHVSPEVASWLLSAGDSYDKPRFVDAVILLADIRSFTEKCLRIDPKQIVADLSSYLDTVVDMIHRHGGFVDKFIGDAVLVVWGVTPEEENLAAKALACARDMVGVAAQLRFAGEPIEIGVGLSRGRVFVGNVGGDGKRQFTVLGPAVNLASRLESECKPLGARIVAGEDFYEALPAMEKKSLRRQEGRSIKGVGLQAVYSWSGAPVDQHSVSTAGGKV